MDISSGTDSIRRLEPQKMKKRTLRKNSEGCVDAARAATMESDTRSEICRSVQEEKTQRHADTMGRKPACWCKASCSGRLMMRSGDAARA